MTSELSGSVLVIDPDDAAAAVIGATVEESGYRVRRARTAAEAWAQLRLEVPQVVVLELILPDADGLVLCADLRARLDVPIIVCSAASDRRERILSLRLGADDFIAKPVDPEELQVRLEARLRRATRRDRTAGGPGDGVRDRAGDSAGSLRTRLGGLFIDRLTCRATADGRELRLTPTEFRLLSVFISRPNEPLTREVLARAAGDDLYLSGSRALDMHVRRLRAKLNQAAQLGAAGVPAIASVRGQGYRLAPRPGSRFSSAA